MWAVLEMMAYACWKIGSLLFTSWSKSPPKFVKERIKIQLLRKNYKGISADVAIEEIIREYPGIMLEEIRQFQSLIPSLRIIGYREAEKIRENKISKVSALENIEMEVPGHSKKVYKDVLAQGLHESR